MILAMLITVSMAQIRTSTNTCTNEKTIFKLDIRQRVSSLPTNSTIKNLNASAICEEAYAYDYIWLSSLWTPGEFNYKNVNGDPQQTKDYKELQSIKEYSIDQALGSLADLDLFQTNLKVNCPHMKFLGEFSFYVSADSQLLENATRFLRRPTSLSRNIYDSRYDNDNFVWAVNDQMKTIPYAVPWNYFSNVVINDMKDIIYRVIIDQHKLDGIVFLQPSLGLYSVMNYNFQPEISFYGASSLLQLLQDFYQSFGLKQNSQTLFFMGGEDSSNSKIILQNYLQQIHGSPISNTWANINYTFTLGPQAILIDDKMVQGDHDNLLGHGHLQFAPANPPTCMIYQIMTEGDIRVGFSNPMAVKWMVAMNGSFVFSDNPPSDTFFPTYYKSDIIEIQMDQSTEQFIFKKYSIDHTSSYQLSLMYPGGYNNLIPSVDVSKSAKIQIKFPFQFSEKYKHSYLVIENSQQIKIQQSYPQDIYSIAQIWPSINQNENIVTLNFKVSNLPSGNDFFTGVCNQDIVTTNGQQLGSQQQLGKGVSGWLKGGWVIHSSDPAYINIQNYLYYGQGDIIGVSYIKSNSTILFYKNQIYAYQFPLGERIKNLNFCIGFFRANSVINLVY